jgi:predicted site-specific integrase-resolvase
VAAAAPVDDRLLPPAETAHRLGISPRTLIRLANDGEIERVPVLGSTRYRASDVARIIRFGTSRKRAA